MAPRFIPRKPTGMMNMRLSTPIMISIALLVAIALFVFLGCSCRGREGFETKDAEARGAAAAMADTKTDSENPLTTKEQELFQDLKENRIPEKDLARLIADGTINEKVVTKFLNKLTSDAASTAPAPEKFYGGKY